MSSLLFAGVGLVFFLAARIGFPREDPMHFGSWRHAPQWARNLFGSSGGSISPYKLSVELAGLTWAIGWFAIAGTGDPPGAPLRQILSASVLLSLVACAVCWVVATVGEELRDR
jgi:hypothetical protein